MDFPKSVPEGYNSLLGPEDEGYYTIGDGSPIFDVDKSNPHGLPLENLWGTFRIRFWTRFVSVISWIGMAFWVLVAFLL